MSAVVLRCDNCGTSHSARGECQTCHEGQVRYYCKNHDPGRWLDGPMCTQCGAKYGVTISPPPTRPPVGTVRSGGARKSAATSSDVPYRTPVPPKKRGPWGSRPARSEEIPVSDELVARARAIERLRHMLGGAAYGRRVPDATDVTYGSPAPRIAGGCFRIVLLFVFLFLMLSLLGSNFGTLMLGF
jgi:hypothetical protein